MSVGKEIAGYVILTEEIRNESNNIVKELKDINEAEIVKWKSGNKNIATVSQDGVVHTKKSGYVRITAFGENGYKGSAVVHVRKAPYRFEVKPKKPVLTAGQDITDLLCLPCC